MNPKILVVEDQTGPLESLALAVRIAILNEKTPLDWPDDVEADLRNRGIDVARCYQEAESAIKERLYDVVFLDHRLPYGDCRELERKDFDAFCKQLDGIGYRLIPRIKERNPESVIIGTSSLHADELRRFSQPDYKLDKCGRDVSGDLRKILEDRR